MMFTTSILPSSAGYRPTSSRVATEDWQVLPVVLHVQTSSSYYQGLSSRLVLPAFALLPSIFQLDNTATPHYGSVCATAPFQVKNGRPHFKNRPFRARYTTPHEYLFHIFGNSLLQIRRTYHCTKPFGRLQIKAVGSTPIALPVFQPSRGIIVTTGFG